MNYFLKYSIFFLILLSSCNLKKNTDETLSQNENCFSKGQILNSPNFTGIVWLNMMGAKDSSLNTNYGHVSFEPGARTNWHLHPGGQLLFITKGKGYYQAKGQSASLLQKGDYVEIPSNTEHWHGAAQDSEFSHIAVSLSTDLGATVWLKPVSNDEYALVQE